jgi:hypothetical protein
MLFKPLWIKLKCLDVLEKYQTWPKIFFLHLIVFKIIYRVYCFRGFFESLVGALISIILSLIEFELNL